MATSAMTLAALLLFAVAALADRSLLQASTAAAPGTSNKPFDFGRPCTLLGSSSAVEITGPNNAACTPCGSGATATPEPTCTFKTLDVPLGYTISIFYHSSVHHLYLGNSACAFTTEICKNTTSETYTSTAPCTYKFSTPGSYFISDKAGSNGADDGGYCKDFGASIPITVATTS